MKRNDIIFGFKLNRICPVKEIDGELYIFEHIKSGAELIWIKREDENKTFSISFKTTPYNDTGVFHILEHSTLCGSKKYPVKDPFVKMLESSCQTYLNAMTYPDKTVYPVSSRNDKDFMNLMDIYLDAVFNPAFLDSPNAFLQEGWHFEGDDEGNTVISGVVFNEMQGVVSGLNEKIHIALNRELFYDTCYKYVYGGHPESIVDLSYEEFVKTYKKYYTASNARIMLDGSVDINIIMKYIDEEYLSKFEKNSESIKILPQREFTPRKSSYKFNVSKDENNGKKNILVLGRVFGDFSDILTFFGTYFVCNYLCSTNESPLKRAILDSGLADDIDLSIENYGIQNMLVITVENCRKEDFSAIRNLIMKVISREIKKGFDKDEIKAHLNKQAFLLSEHSENYGIDIMMSILKSRLYDGAPELYLEDNKVIETMKNKLNTKYFEELAKITFEDEAFYEIQMLADTKAWENETRKFEDKINGILGNMSESDCDEYNQKISDYAEWLKTPDSEENLKKMPTLSILDIDRKPDVTLAEEGEFNKVKLLKVPVQNNSITYLNFYFALTENVNDKLFELSLLTNLFTNLPTKNYSLNELHNKINMYLGDISFSILPVAEKQCFNFCKAFLVVECSCLNENVDKAFELVKEIILNTKFDEKNRIKECTVQLKNILKERIASQGDIYAEYSALSGISSEGGVIEQTTGYSFYNKLKDFSVESIPVFKELVSDIFAKRQMTLGYSGIFNEEAFTDFSNSLPNGNWCPGLIKAMLEKESREGIKISGSVAFTALADNTLRGKAAGYVSAHIATYSYLWDEVRVKNGAYGTSLQYRKNGDVVFKSFRDPHPFNSIVKFMHTGRALRSMEISEKDLELMKIGTICDIEPLLTDSQKCKIACDNYFLNIDYEFQKKLKEDIIDLTKEDLIKFSTVFDSIEYHGKSFVVGNEDYLDYCNATNIKTL